MVHKHKNYELKYSKFQKNLPSTKKRTSNHRVKSKNALKINSFKGLGPTKLPEKEKEIKSPSKN